MCAMKRLIPFGVICYEDVIRIIFKVITNVLYVKIGLSMILFENGLFRDTKTGGS